MFHNKRSLFWHIFESDYGHRFITVTASQLQLQALSSHRVNNAKE